MGEPDFKAILNEILPEDREKFLSFLTGEESDFIEKIISENAVTFEYPEWQLTVFSLEELTSLIDSLSTYPDQNIQSPTCCCTDYLNPTESRVAA